MGKSKNDIRPPPENKIISFLKTTYIWFMRLFRKNRHGEILRHLNFIKQQNFEIMTKLEEALQKLAAQNDTLKTLSLGVTGAQGSLNGIQGDITGMKVLIASLQSGGSGATPEQIDQLEKLVNDHAANIDDLSKKISDIGKSASDIDAETPEPTPAVNG